MNFTDSLSAMCMRLYPKESFAVPSRVNIQDILLMMTMSLTFNPLQP